MKIVDIVVDNIHGVAVVALIEHVVLSFNDPKGWRCA